ncbi:thioesterase II family protein [uncultured Bradyrhizobium sp.]|uniref:thioesterase II family protein n=1 Tax=uncultured Bradyrhizobium sp. TaxID=199684 RepID=UPI0035CBCFF4
MQPNSPRGIDRNPWVAAGGISPNARLRLFCLPPAGGGAALYRGWMQRLAPEVDVIPVTLPGREMRFAEPPITRLDVLTDRAATGLRPLLDRPYALFGYSMGALLAHRLAHRLAAERLGEPIHLFAAAHRGPGIQRGGPELHELPHDEFWQRLATYDGMPREVIENQELRGVLEPLLRADFSVVETAEPAPEAVLSCPITAIGGDADRSVTVEEIDAWRIATVGNFERLTLPGHHFFIAHSQELLLRIVAERLRNGPAQAAILSSLRSRDSLK